VEKVVVDILNISLIFFYFNMSSKLENKSIDDKVFQKVTQNILAIKKEYAYKKKIVIVLPYKGYKIFSGKVI